jgi:hypothetical protein
MTEEEKAAADKAAADKVKQQELNLGAKGDGDAVKALEARAKAAEEKAAKLEAENKKRDEAKAKADKDAASAKAIEDGKAKDVIAQQAKDLAEAKEKADRLESAAKARVAKMEERLSDAAKKRLDIVRAKLSIDEVETFVASELETDGKTDAGGGASFTPGGGTGSNKDSIKMHDESKEVLANIGVEQSPIDKMSKMAKRTHNAVTGKSSFVVPIQNMIKDMNARRARTVQLTAENAGKRGQ